MTTDTVPELFGPYRIEELLGRGGMGEVHRAYDTGNDRHVALKRLPGFADAEFRARFRREARLVAGLDEPHIVPIHDHGEIDGRLYLDMALIDGPDLKRVLADGPLSPSRAIEILTQVARALDAAHAAGVLHRDVKPANILLDEAGNAYLADFGIARPLADDVTKLTNTGDYVGTLDYMAPERLMRGEVDVNAASDVYALACVLFQCLTGRVPFPAPDTVGKLAAQLNDPPPAPSLFDRRIPPAMDLVVRTGMEKDPKRRYPSAGELMAAAAAVTAESPTAVSVELPRTGDHFVHLLMSYLQDETPTPGENTADSCPYPGLQSFGIRDSDWFFGREQAVRDLLARLSRQRGGDGPLIVVGASGAGKSSLLHAGLLAAQARAGEKSLAMTPGDRPVGTLAARLAALTRTDPLRLAGRLWERPSDFGELCRVAAGENAPLVVAVDQAEEMFTLCHDPREREVFATALASAWPARVVLAVRADFVEHCITLPPLKPSLDAPYVLGPLSAEELARVVTKPAEVAGLELEPGLVDRLVTDVGAGRDPGALPRLAHALRETWRNRTGNRLTLTGYQRTGGVDRAVALTADGVYNRLAPADQWALRGALLRMVTLLDGGGIARRRAHRSEVPHRALESLVSARLVTVDADAVSLSHDALLTSWPRLRQWVDEDRAALLVRQQLGEAVTNWRKGGQDRGDLYRGARLAAALDWSNGRADVSADERAFLTASERDRRRTTRRLRGFVVGLAALLVLALVAGGIAFVARGEADEARNEAQSRALAAESLSEADADPVDAMRKAVEGWHTAETVEARGALLSAPMLTYPTAFKSGLRQGYAIDVSADGRYVAVGSGEGEVAVWDVVERRRLDIDITAARTVLAVKFSPDGTMLAVSSVDPTDNEVSGVKVWSIPDRKLIRRLSDVNEALGPIAWRPDGQAVAAISVRADVTMAIGEFDPTTGNLIRWIGTAQPNTISIAYSVRGDRLAAGNGAGRLDLWNTANGTLVSTNTEHLSTARMNEDGIVSVLVAFSPELLATASVADNTIRLWNPETGALVRSFRDITRHVTDPGQGPSALVFSPDGTVLYTNSNTTALSIWDPLTGSYAGSITQGRRGGSSAAKTVLAIAVSRDGRTRVASASDGAVLRWHTNVSWHSSPTESVTGLDISPDGHTATAGDASGAITSWDIRTGDEVGGQGRLDSATYAVRYTPDGTRITGSITATLTVTTTRGGVSRPRSIHLTGREFRGAIAVSPDGKLFAAAHGAPVRLGKESDYRIGVWDVATLAQRAELKAGEQSPAELLFSSDGERLLALTNNEGTSVVGSDTDGTNTATLLGWRLPDLTEEDPVRLGSDSLITSVFTPDGRSLLTAGTGRMIEIRDPRTGRVLDRFGRHSSTIRKIAISRDGRIIATITSDDSVVRLWDLRSKRLLAVLTGHVAPVNELVFAPDGKSLASGGTDTDIGVWQLAPDQVVRRLCANLADAGETDLASIGC
ncbi:protein kinase domain-containing protein [Actinophytocola oryzae]|uniref:non-specific serine/threonine protein kinase n=1 Tax=Actinophytocola oryzae TaxID=502181 RepID=A0A4R7VZN8_9PSEU|nr:protein kinase [Actinophytocola oryzae]TDV55029.1 serine/threonine protein kinase [Actinophytocola oryzae]